MVTINWNGFQAVDENLPLPLPGVYRLTCVENGKMYIGISQNVLRRLKQYCGTINGVQRKLSNAFRKHGRARFIIEPICYSIGTDTEWLLFVERELIKEYDTVNSGYNINETGGTVGPYGAEFRRIQKERWADPQVRADRRAAMLASDGWAVYQQRKSDPEFNERRIERLTKTLSDPAKRREISERTREAMGRPEVREKLFAGMAAAADKIAAGRIKSGQLHRKRWARMTPEERTAATSAMRSVERTEEFEARRKAAIAAVLGTPEKRAERGEISRTSWADPEKRANRIAGMNDPVVIAEHRRRASARMADPNERARTSAATRQAMARPEVRAKVKGPRRIGIWITDGISNRRLLPGAAIPDGWQAGRTRSVAAE